MVTFKIFFLVIACGLGLSERNNWGREFVIPFLSNFEKKGTIYLYLTTRNDASVYVEIPWENRQETVSISAGTSETVSLDWQSRYEEDSVPVKKAVYINSSVPLAVCSFSFVSNSGSSFLALPVDVLGDHYMAVSYTRVYYDTSVIAAAVEDGTEVTFHYNVDGGSCGPDGFTSGETSTHVINRLEVIGIHCSEDLTGTRVTSNKPISVVSGNIGGSIPIGKGGKDVFEEMMIPVKDLGTEHVLANAGRAEGAKHRIVAVSDNTIVTSSNGNIYNLMTSEFFDTDTDIDGKQFIQSNKPIQVTAFGRSVKANSDSIGDPLMVVVPPVSSFSYDYFIDYDIVATTSRYKCKDLITVIGAVADMPQLETLLGETHTPIAGSDYAVIYKEITTWPFQLPTDNTTRSAVLLYQVSSSFLGAGLPFGMILTPQYCWTSSCLNGGTCEELGASFHCYCPVGFTGDRCENESENASSSDLDLPTTVMIDVPFTSYDMDTLELWDISNELMGTNSSRATNTTFPVVTDSSPSTDNSFTHIDTSADSREILPTTTSVNIETFTIVYMNELRSSQQVAMSSLSITSPFSDPNRDLMWPTQEIANTQSNLKHSSTVVSQDPVQPSFSSLHTPVDLTGDVKFPVDSVSFTQYSEISSELTVVISKKEDMPVNLPPEPPGLPQTVIVPDNTVDDQTVVNIPQIFLSSANLSLDLPHVPQLPFLSAEEILKSLHDKAASLQMNAVGKVCTCLCRGSRLENMDDVAMVTDSIQSELLLDTKALSKTIRKYISAPDKRDSVRKVGAVGIVMMALTFGVMVISDVLSVMNEIWRYCRKSP